MVDVVIRTNNDLSDLWRAASSAGSPRRYSPTVAEINCNLSCPIRAVFMKSHLSVLETQETQQVLLAGMEYLVSFRLVFVLFLGAFECISHTMDSSLAT